ncbi:2-hydroxy-3-oxopropionate reductase [Nonomuraea typhae]|uniref:2-hydroxy-3-oxopropionate reductase n=2 Tax=Nonomuraea typhae TaxID=2603600 RepID=UPI0012F7B98D|nr:2-hydroxy-3-oxopropionate reductase [Nonomuraea typhae]
MTNVTVIGLGIMGAPMAANLIKAGYSVTGVNKEWEKVEHLIELGGQGAHTIADGVRDADVIVTMLPDTPDVELVSADIVEHARKGSLWIDASSIRPDAAARLAGRAAEAGLRAVDAPVSGGEQGAIDATLSIMVGGNEADVEAARPILEAVGSTVVHVGPSGSGQTVKAANQLIVAGTIQLVAEAIVFLEAHGVDTDAAVKVLSAGLAGNRILERKAEGMLGRSFKPGFRIDLHHKDMGIVTAAAREAGVALPVGAILAQLMASARLQGHGQLDHTALLLLVEQLSGRGERQTP